MKYLRSILFILSLCILIGLTLSRLTNFSTIFATKIFHPTVKGEQSLEQGLPVQGSEPTVSRAITTSPPNLRQEKQAEEVSSQSEDIKYKSKTSCCLIAAKYMLENLCPTNKVTAVNCSCTDYITCKLVMVTALSSNHFDESLDYFGSVYAMFPSKKIIVYDLGLTESEISRIQSYCNVQEVRKFKFDKYPSHTKELFNYAWKPFIISEMSQEYEVFFYCDASCRMKKKLLSFLSYLLKFPILPAMRLNKSVVRTTHDGMLKYFKVQRTRLELVNTLTRSFPGGANVYWANDVFKEKFLLPFVDCASHVECIAPAGAGLHGCNFNRPIDQYVGCHRFDQSAMNIILIRDFGRNFTNLYGDDGEIPTVDLVDIQRSKTRLYNNKTSWECNIVYP